jgi:hypothetical protein
MRPMGSRRTSALLQLPVRLGGDELGRPVDLLLDTGSWRALGFVVRCGDAARRFLPYAAAVPRDEEIAVVSALLLLDDLGFYARRSASLRGLLGGEVTSGGRPEGRLRDLVVAGPHGSVVALLTEREGRERRLEPGVAVVAPRRASAA